MVEVTLGRT